MDSARDMIKLDPNLSTRVSELSVPLLTDNEILEIINQGCKCLNKIGFVSPERRYEAPGCCTAAAKVIIIMGKDAGFSWFPNRSVAINNRENRLKPLYKIKEQRHHSLKTCHK